MIRLRVLLAWLLLAALPLQGFAAATMLLCGPAQKVALQAAPAAAPAHDATHHAHGTGHVHESRHAPAHEGGGDVHGHHGHAAPQASHGDDEAGHSCGLCAAHCHSLGIPASAPVLSAPQLPPAHQAQVVAAIHTRSTPVPDKPPRG